MRRVPHGSAMPLAVVARTFEEPFDIDGFEGIRNSGKWCYDL